MNIGLASFARSNRAGLSTRAVGFCLVAQHDTFFVASFGRIASGLWLRYYARL